VMLIAFGLVVAGVVRYRRAGRRPTLVEVMPGQIAADKDTLLRYEALRKSG
jgi:hypothetical protein